MAGLFDEPYKYVIDSSALFDLKNLYSPTTFKSLWEKFNRLCHDGVIISVKEVYNEIKRGEDWLLEWADEHKKIFLEPQTIAEFELIGKLQDQNPAWVDPNSERPKADPFVISSAKIKNLIIIQHEGAKKDLPRIAATLGVECIRLLDFFNKEGWEF